MSEIYTIFDTETTGLSPDRGDRIVELAALQIIDGKITQENFVTLINPGRRISPGASAVNGITDEMVKAAPKIEEILPYFMEFVGDSTIVAHNAQFDMRFLKAELAHCDLNISLPQSLCTVQYSKRLFPYERYHNLDDVAFRLDIDIDDEERHRAMGDVITTAQVFLKFKEMEKAAVTTT